MSIYELDAKVMELREIQAMIADLEAEAEAIKEIIKNKMCDEGTEELVGNGWKATWHTVTSSRLDSKKLKAELPDLYRRYTKTSSATRFTLA